MIMKTAPAPRPTRRRFGPEFERHIARRFTRWPDTTDQAPDAARTAMSVASARKPGA